MRKKYLFALSLVVALLWLSGCMRSPGTVEDDPGRMKAESGMGSKPSLPEKLEIENGIPMLNVYNVSSKKVENMDIESYVQGVLAGEMRNDWPIEALKAQAILARTFVLKFVSEKSSKYKGADISTDIQEAQAYDEAQINDKIIKAVEETRGEIIAADGAFPYAWFHAHAGGKTELATVALEYKQAEPPYTQVTNSPDSEKAPDNVKNWTATYSAKQVGAAAADAGVKTGAVTSIEIGETGESGRAKTLMINGKSVSAPALRLALGGKEVKSTLFDEVKLENGKVTFSGKGYGHGVGMSQWGAYGMADEGKPAEEIVSHYFKNVEIMTLWE